MGARRDQRERQRLTSISARPYSASPAIGNSTRPAGPDKACSGEPAAGRRARGRGGQPPHRKDSETKALRGSSDPTHGVILPSCP